MNTEEPCAATFEAWVNTSPMARMSDDAHPIPITWDAAWQATCEYKDAELKNTAPYKDMFNLVNSQLDRSMKRAEILEAASDAKSVIIKKLLKEAEAKQIPDGYVLVPKEPTPEMYAYTAECTKQIGADAKRLMGYTYHFMLEAAPKPE